MQREYWCYYLIMLIEGQAVKWEKENGFRKFWHAIMISTFKVPAVIPEIWNQICKSKFGCELILNKRIWFLKFYDQNFYYPSFLKTYTFICAFEIKDAWFVYTHSINKDPTVYLDLFFISYLIGLLT